MQERVFGRLEWADDRDNDYLISSVMPTISPQIKQKYWWADGWWGDQGTTSQCVAYSWLHLLEDGPVIQNHIENRSKPLINPLKLYGECQIRDPWAGENYAGTSVRAAAKVLKDLGIIKEYRWAKSITDVVNTLLTIGPLVVGTKWYSGMNSPDSSGIIRTSGTDLGGHAYVLNGVNTETGMIRIKNSWSQNWGNKGYGFIKLNEFEKLLTSGGEACIAFETKLTEQLDWSKLRPPGVYTD